MKEVKNISKNFLKKLLTTSKQYVIINYKLKGSVLKGQDNLKSAHKANLSDNSEVLNLHKKIKKTY